MAIINAISIIKMFNEYDDDVDEFSEQFEDYQQPSSRPQQHWSG